MKANGYENDKLKPGDILITGIYETGIYEKGIESVYPELFLFGGAKAGQLAYKGMQKFLMSNAGIKMLLYGGALTYLGCRVIDKIGYYRLTNILLSNPVTVNRLFMGIIDGRTPGLPDLGNITTPAGWTGYSPFFFFETRNRIKEVLGE